MKLGEITVFFVVPAFVYNLLKLMRSTIFNFSQATSELNVDKFPSYPNYFACNCSNLLYFDKNHGHIVTGHL